MARESDSTGRGAHVWSPDQMPHALVPLIDRELELEYVLGRLVETRLVTLVGLSGVGKTRLAQVVAQQTALFPGGIGWLAGSGDHRAAAVRAGLKRWPRGEGIRLLIVDGAEALSGGARRAVLAWLAADRQARCLATSVAPLGHAQEQIVTVGPLSVEGEGESPAAALWGEVRRRADWQWSPKAIEREQLERRCAEAQGFPLAIELAAASPETADPLDLTSDEERDEERHRSLRAALSHSWQALTRAQQEAVRRLAVGETEHPAPMIERLRRLGWLLREQPPELLVLARRWVERTEGDAPQLGRAVWAVRLFGGLRIRRWETDVPLDDWWAKASRVFAFLAIHCGEGVERTRLLEMFWPGEELEPALHRLQTTISEIRRTLRAHGDKLIESRQGVYTLGAGGLCATDLQQARALLEEAERRFPGVEAAAATAERLARTRPSSLLPEFPHEDWCVLERERYHELWGGALVRLAEACGHADDWGAAVRIAEVVAEEDPSEESACRVLLRGFTHMGRAAAAARAFRRCEAALRSEYGLPPSQVTAALFDRVRLAPAPRR